MKAYLNFLQIQLLWQTHLETSQIFKMIAVLYTSKYLKSHLDRSFCFKLFTYDVEKAWGDGVILRILIVANEAPQMRHIRQQQFVIVITLAMISSSCTLPNALYDIVDRPENLVNLRSTDFKSISGTKHSSIFLF